MDFSTCLDACLTLYTTALVSEDGCCDDFVPREELARMAYESLIEL